MRAAIGLACAAVACAARPVTTNAPRIEPSASAHRAVDVRDLSRGTHASGIVGDFVLENRFVRAIISDIPNAGGFALTGGNLVDLSPRDGRDELGLVFTYLGRFPRQLAYRSLRMTSSSGGRASIIVEGTERRTPGLDGTTEYSLGHSDRALSMRTTLVNRGAAAVDVGLGDAIQWAAAEHWAPGIGFAMRGQTREPYVAGVGVFTAYAYAAPTALHGPNGGNWSDPVQAERSLAPGETVTYERRIGVSSAGDVSGALRATGYVARGTTVAIHAENERGTALADARIAALDAAGMGVALAATDRTGAADIDLPVTASTLVITAAGRTLAHAWIGAHEIVSNRGRIDLPAPVLPTLRVRFGPPSTLRVRVREAPIDAPAGATVAAPARVLIRGVDGTSDPTLGPIGRAEGARNAYVIDASGVAVIPVAPGRYRVAATRGPERSLAETTVEVRDGQESAVDLEVRRVVDTRGYVCGDFHTHQAPSLDSPVSLRDRVRAAAGEGLDVIASTDHNVVSDLAPAVRDEHLEAWLLTIPGDELSTDIAVHPAGHWNLFPLAYDAASSRGGAPDMLELDTPTLIARARAAAPDAVLQVNHPRSGSPTGLFDVVQFDPSTGRARGPFSQAFDAIEVWNGRFQPQADVVLLDWFALLRTGARITATANSDSHAIVVQEVGYPRTCLRVPDDRVGHFTVGDVVRALRETRDVVLTDGPFIRVLDSRGESAIGRTFAPEANGELRLHVTVESPVWSAADSLELVHADGRAEPIAATWQRTPDVVRGSADVRVRAPEPFVVVRARGTGRIDVLVDDPPMMPLGISNPVWIAQTPAPAAVSR